VKHFALFAVVFPLATLLGAAAEPDKDAAYYNRLLGRGINFGNCLEAPNEGAWGMKLEADFFQKIKDAGFNSVRIPINWAAHAKNDPPYEIDPKFFERIDWAIDQGLSRGLAVVINVHHYDGIFREPAKHQPRLEALWRQIARRYKDRPDRLFFELLNEPQGALNDEKWSAMIPPLLAAIRESNPERIVIVGPASWNNLHHFDNLTLPERDCRLIVTFHDYSPMEFTHQGAEFMKDSKKWLGRKWPASPKDEETLHKEFDKAAEWGKKHHRPLYLGEFGSYHFADMDSRARWTQAMVQEAGKHGMSWAYWEFGAGFGAYDREAKTWRQALLTALVELPSTEKR
jgi:endoglucanase